MVAPFMAGKTKSYGYFGPVGVIPNGLQVPPLDLASIARKAAGPPLLATIGNNGRLKNVHRSVAAFQAERCVSNFRLAQLHLFGPGLDAEYVADEIGVVGHGNVAHDDLMRFLANEAAFWFTHPLWKLVP